VQHGWYTAGAGDCRFRCVAAIGELRDRGKRTRPREIMIGCPISGMRALWMRLCSSNLVQSFGIRSSKASAAFFRQPNTSRWPCANVAAAWPSAVLSIQRVSGDERRALAALHRRSAACEIRSMEGWLHLYMRARARKRMSRTRRERLDQTRRMKRVCLLAVESVVTVSVSSS
jgi:hypothetical protein